MKKDDAAGRKKYEAPAITRVFRGSSQSKTLGIPAPGSNHNFRIVLNREGRLQQVSKEFCALVGYEPDQLLGRLIDDLTVANTVNIPQHLGAVAQFGHFHCLWMFAHRGGEAILLRCDWELLPGSSTEVLCDFLHTPGS